MKAWTFAALAASLVSVVSSSPLASRQTAYTAVTGPTDGIVTRLPIQRLQAEYPDVFNVYLLALVCRPLGLTPLPLTAFVGSDGKSPRVEPAILLSTRRYSRTTAHPMGRGSQRGHPRR